MTGESIKKDTPRYYMAPVVNYQLTPLAQHPRSELDPQQILCFFEKQLGDYLRLTAFQGETRRFNELTDFAPHGLLTFGTVVDRTAGIVGHFPSTPTPVWSCFPYRSEVDATYSKSVPSRVDLSIAKLAGPSRAELHFRLRLRSEDRYRLRAAFLARSLDFYHDDPDGLVQVEILHGMPCIKYPFPDSFFYWSLDEKGTRRIPEADWEKYEIPRLKVETWISSMWQWYNYHCVKDWLQLKGYHTLDGRQCAQDRNYPELLEGDPHEIRFDQCEQSETVAPEHLHAIQGRDPAPDQSETDLPEFFMYLSTEHQTCHG
ncbi:hypothetical protein V5O48_017311 [Marasmius crinis-equi]|uniref:Uncharacterized protein n=1 Tax=Marasmius crinis-equi TaxID=585013 RepID=A0ABR3EPC0_9AGAR